MQDTNNAPGSWLGHRLINKAAAEEMGASVLPSDKALAGRVWLALSDADGDPLFVAGIVVGVTFTAAEVRYSLAFPVAPQPTEGETMYAVVDQIPSGLVLSELPDDETVFDAVMTEDAAVLIPREPLVATPDPALVLDSANLLAGGRLEGELAERVAALESALATDAEPMYTLGVIREVVSLTAQVRAGEPAPAVELDPTEWPGYAEVLRDEGKAIKWQDRLDSFFSERVVALRNALRALGWDGEQWGDLSKSGVAARFDFWQVGAGKNVVGMTVNGIQDDLTKNVDELAAAIDATAALPIAPDAPIANVTLTGDELGQFEDTPEGAKALREAAKAHFTAMLGQWVPCPALGGDVELRKSGMKKVLSLSGDKRKLKLIPAIKQMIGAAVKVSQQQTYAPEREQNIVAYHLLRATATLAGESLAVRFIVKQDDKGAFHWDHTVHAADAVFDSVAGKGKGPDESDPSPTATSDGRAVQAVEPIGATRLVSCQLDSIVGESAEVFNLFIEGEAPEAVVDDDEQQPSGPSAQFESYRAFIEKELAEGRTIPAGMLEIIRMDTRLEDGEAAQLEALATATPAPTPQEKRSMEQLIKIAADSIAQLRRIDVYRVLEAAGDQRAELATFIATNRAELVREVTDVMAEEWPGLGWTFTPAAEPALVERAGGGGELLVPNQDGKPKELVVPPVPEVEVKSEQELQNPARSGDLAFLNGVISQSVDMWDDALADKIEAMAGTYESDAEMMELVGRAINSYTDFMIAAA